MHIHAKLPMVPQHVAAPPQPKPRPAASTDGGSDVYRVTAAKDRDGSGNSRQERPARREQNGREPGPTSRRDPAAALAGMLLELKLDSQD